MQIDHVEKEQVMSRTVVFKSIAAISDDMGEKPSPVRTLEPHIDFYARRRAPLLGPRLG
jgi:hypothetical protein